MAVVEPAGCLHPDLLPVTEVTLGCILLVGLDSLTQNFGVLDASIASVAKGISEIE